MEEIILYSNGCPQCKFLKKLLGQKDIYFTEVNDVDLMISKGFMSMPMLEVNGTVMNYASAMQWANKQ